MDLINSHFQDFIDFTKISKDFVNIFHKLHEYYLKITQITTHTRTTNNRNLKTKINTNVSIIKTATKNIWLTLILKLKAFHLSYCN